MALKVSPPDKALIAVRINVFEEKNTRVVIIAVQKIKYNFLSRLKINIFRKQQTA